MAKNKVQPVRKPETVPAVKTTKPVVPFFQDGFWKRHWLPALLLVLASFGLYQESIKYGFVLDDEMVYWKNAYVQDGVKSIGKIFGNDSFMGYFQKKEDLYRLEGGRYRPLSLATFAIEADLLRKPKPTEQQIKDAKFPPEQAKLASGSPHLAHFVNILLYGLSGILLYYVLLGLFPLKEGRGWWTSTAFLASILFIFHPLHSECVANIKGRDEILALMGSLATLYAAMKYHDRGNPTWLAMTAVFFLLGLFSKENTLTFLAVVPLTLWMFSPAAREEGKTAQVNLTGIFVALGIAAFVFVLVRFKALGYMLDHGKAVKDLMNDSFLGMSFGEKMATIFLTLGWYVKLLFVPTPLTHDYYPYHVPKVGWGDWRAITSFLLYAGMGVWALLNVRKRSVAAYCILFYLITLSIVSNLVVSVGSFMNERFIYISSVAFCVLVAWLLSEKLPALLRQAPEKSVLALAVLAPVLIWFAYIIIKRVPDWETGLSLNTSAVRNSPGSARAQSFYTTSIYQEIYANAKSPEEKARWVDTMEYHVRKALEINPDYGSAWVMRANIATARFEIDKQMDKVFNEWSYCLEKSPYVTMLRNNIDQYMKYLATSGGNPNKINTFAYRVGYEFYYQKRNDPRSALQFLEYGIMTQTDDPRVLNAAAEMCDKLNQAAKAAEYRQRALANN